jgi:hypothetical protein
VPHSHAHGGNKLQHRLCGENGFYHIVSGVEMASVGDSALASYAVMWQFRNPHIPKRTKLTLRSVKNRKVVFSFLSYAFKRRMWLVGFVVMVLVLAWVSV